MAEAEGVWRGRLLGHLLQSRSEFMVQGEVFATLGLGFVLQDAKASKALSDLLEIAPAAGWQAEERIAIPGGGVGRPDLLGHQVVGERTLPTGVVEAKIHQDLDELQLRQFASWQHEQLAAAHAPSTVRAVLGVLVPRRRLKDARRAASSVSKATGRPVVAITWEETFERAQAARLSPAARCDLDQLIDLYNYYLGNWVAPFTPEETSIGWEGRKDDYWRLADQLTQQLRESVIAVNGVAPARTLPKQRDGQRSVTLSPPPENAHVAVGLFRRLEGAPPFAVRFHPGDAGPLTEISERLTRSALDVETGPESALFVRLRVPAHVSQTDILASLNRQLLEVLRIAHPGLGARLPE